MSDETITIRVYPEGHEHQGETVHPALSPQETNAITIACSVFHASIISSIALQAHDPFLYPLAVSISKALEDWQEQRAKEHQEEEAIRSVD